MAKLRVLIVDDEPRLIRAVERSLRTQLEIHGCHSGADALALLRTEEFAVVVSDLQMPGMNGAEFLAQVTELAPRTAQIMLTGTFDYERLVADKRHIFRCLEKPCPNDVLAQAIVAAAAAFAPGAAAGSAA